MNLETLYVRAIQACAPDALIRRVIRDDVPRSVVAIGKCAGALLDGFGEFDRAFVVVPKGYPRPAHRGAAVFEGGHPQMTADSFRAGMALLDFVAAQDAVTFLISGGGSACVEWPLEPFSQSDLVDANAALLRSGAAIGEINAVRKHLSAIKGGRLAARLRRSVTLIYSDVSTGAFADVASGPSVADPTTKEQASAIARRAGIALNIDVETPKRMENSEVHLIADNRTLTAAAATIAKEMACSPVLVDHQIETDVADAAEMLADAVRSLRTHEVLIAGGEPTVVQRGDGKGGRCSELAVRFALAANDVEIDALFGSSDGVDGNSGAAAVMIQLPSSMDRGAAERALAQSNSMAVIEAHGRAIPLRPTGNNLRDLYLLACS